MKLRVFYTIELDFGGKKELVWKDTTELGLKTLIKKLIFPGYSLVAVSRIK